MEKVLELNKAFEGLFFAGDSAGLVDNWTGEGIDFALDSGRQAALSIVEDGIKGKTAGQRYLERLYPIVKHLQIADSFRRRFHADLQKNVLLLKSRRSARIFMNYISRYAENVSLLVFKSFFTGGIHQRST
jgi:flavin-dependent dehydrogenase